MKNKIMLDLETMGNDSKSAIIAIGAVAFNDNVIVDRFYTQVNLTSAMRYGGFVDGSTVMWWLKQSKEARAAFENNDTAPDILTALSSFSEWYGKVNGGEVWGNGAMFDNSILSSAYKNCGVEQPWKFWDDMCYRTIKNMYKRIKLNRVGTYHNAVDDAESQALHLIEILKSR